MVLHLSVSLLLCCPAAWSAAPALAQSALRSALLPVLCYERLQLLPGELPVRGEDGPWLAVEVLPRGLGVHQRLVHVAHRLLQPRPVLLHPRAVPVLPLVRLFSDDLLPGSSIFAADHHVRG